MKPFVFGILIAVLAFVAYPKRQAILCMAMPDNASCQPVVQEPVMEAVVLPQKVFKWTDEQGVVHYGEQKVDEAVRIDETLEDLTVISGGKEAMKRNQAATNDFISSGAGNTYRSSANSGARASTSSRQAKKQRCASIAGKRDRYPMNSPYYKRYSTQYSQECIL